MSSSDDMTNHTVGATEEVSSAPVESASGENASSLQRQVDNGQPAPFPCARRALTFYSDDDQASSSSRSEGREPVGSNRNPLLNNSANHRHAEAHLHDFRPENRRNQAPSQLYNWQGTKTTIKERFAFLFNNEILSDVRFIVGRGTQQQRIPAHKLVLSSSSAVFDAMFNGTLATASAEIEVPDVEPSAFLAVLLFLYTDEIEIDPETVMTTLYTAKKYAVSPLEKHCVDYLRSNLTSDNAFLLLTQARLFDEPQLAAVCLNTIDKFTNDALNADGFTDIDIDTLIVVLERDTLRIRESKIFQAVSRWSEAECIRQQLRVTPENQRSVLGRALSLVRFPLMSIEEFAMGPAQSGLLTDREIVSLFLYFTVNPKPSIEFEAVSRCRIMGTPLTVCRFQHSDRENRWSYNGMSDSIRFSVDRKIFLVGYGVYGSYYGSAEYDVLIELSHVASGKVVASNSTGFNSDGSCYTFRLLFKEPVEICANMLYTASATFNGPDSHCGIKGMRRVTVDCDSGKSNKITFQFAAAMGDTNGTSVDDGQIPELIFYI